MLLYVDDMILKFKSYVEICELKRQSSNYFETKDLGILKKILSMDVKIDYKERGLLTISKSTMCINCLISITCLIVRQF